MYIQQNLQRIAGPNLGQIFSSCRQCCFNLRRRFGPWELVRKSTVSAINPVRSNTSTHGQLCTRDNTQQLNGRNSAVRTRSNYQQHQSTHCCLKLLVGKQRKAELRTAPQHTGRPTFEQGLESFFAICQSSNQSSGPVRIMLDVPTRKIGTHKS
jgi:hypothetical protein